MTAINNSVGVVTPQTISFDEPLKLQCGETLDHWQLVYETYGTLNSDRSNAILICHALSGDHHAAGYHHEDDRKPGWWDNCIGPGKPIDTNRFFVISLNNLGGCSGSTGPDSINPVTGKVWGPDFPQVRVEDWVESQLRLATALGIEHWAAVVGGSLGGMQAMSWAVTHPEKVKHCVVIAAALRLSAQNIAFNEIARQAITSDPDFAGGHFLDRDTVPRSGLAIARMIGHVTYLSDELMGDKFGREVREAAAGDDVTFQIQSYLRYQGESFVGRFDANTYLLMTRALDWFDLAAGFDNDAVAAFSAAKARFLVLSFSTDWRFSPARSREIVDALVAARRGVSYAEIEASEGHDSFLLPVQRYHDILRRYMNGVADSCETGRIGSDN